MIACGVDSIVNIDSADIVLWNMKGSYTESES